MSTTQQPEALAHAATLEALDMDGVANFVRRLHTENTTLLQGYAAARLEIESLQRRVQEVGATARREHERADRAMRAAQPAGAQQPAIMPKGESAAAQLRAMATNYPAGHLWDKLDAKACIRGALEIEALRASHGQAPAAGAVAGPEDDDSLMLCASDLEHSAIYDNHVEMQSCIRAVAVRVRALAAAPATQPAPQHDGEFWPVDENASRKQLIAQIGQMNFRLTALRQENAGLIKRVAGQAEALQNYQRSHETAPHQEAQEPVAWQSRTRPTWGGNDRPWSPWEPCTKGMAEDCWKTPLLHDWAYEARALYTAPQPSPASQGDALDAALDAFENKERGIPQAHIAAALVAELRAAIDAARAAQEGK